MSIVRSTPRIYGPYCDQLFTFLLDIIADWFYYPAMNDDAIRAFCVERGIELMVLFGSVAGMTERPGSDIDLAVKMKRGLSMAKLELIYHLGALFADREVDLVVLSIDTDPVLLFEIFSSGKPLYEEKPGVFDSERLRAYKLYYDTEKLRGIQAEYLRKFSNGGRNVA